MKTIETLKPGRYSVVQFDNGCFGVIDNEIEGFQTIASGMTRERAVEYAQRLNLRHVWGI